MNHSFHSEEGHIHVRKIAIAQRQQIYKQSSKLRLIYHSIPFRCRIYVGLNILHKLPNTNQIERKRKRKIQEMKEDLSKGSQILFILRIIIIINKVCHCSFVYIFMQRLFFLGSYLLRLGNHRYLPSSLPAVPILRILISPK